jgi:hypothetical protein
MKHPITWIVAMVAGHIAAFAQLNESDTARLQLRAGLSGAWQKGNVELLVLRSKLDGVVADSTGHWVYKTQNSHLYQALGGRRADNDLSSRHYLYYQPRRQVYPFALLYLQTNYRRKLNYRVFGGAGLTVQLLRTPGSNLKVSGGMLFESNRFDAEGFNKPAYNGSPSIALWRGTFYLAGWHQLAQKKVRLFYTAYLQPGLDGNHNHRSSMELGLDLPVWNGLGMQLAYLYVREGVMPLQVRTTDHLFTFGLQYRFIKNQRIR